MCDDIVRACFNHDTSIESLVYVEDCFVCYIPRVITDHGGDFKMYYLYFFPIEQPFV